MEIHIKLLVDNQNIQNTNVIKIYSGRIQYLHSQKPSPTCKRKYSTYNQFNTLSGVFSFRQLTCLIYVRKQFDTQEVITYY